MIPCAPDFDDQGREARMQIQTTTQATRGSTLPVNVETHNGACGAAHARDPYDPFLPKQDDSHEAIGVHLAAVARPRLLYLDLMRGLIMVIMCWDHAKDLLHVGGSGPEPPEMWSGYGLFSFPHLTC